MGRSLPEWGKYIAKRVLFLVVAMLGVITLTFFATRKVGTPVYLMVGTEFDKEMIEGTAKRLGLDQPLWIQYRNYIANLLQGNLGYSRVTYNKVLHDLALKLPASLELAFVSFGLVLAVGIPAGIMAGIKRKSILDRCVMTTTSLGIAIANFWLGLLFIYFFFYLLRWFPAPMGRISALVPPPSHITGLYILDSILTLNGRALLASLHQIILPAVTIAFTISPHIVALTRSTTIYTVNSDHMQNAYSFGLPRSVVARYLAKNIASPVMTISGLTLARMVGGIVLVEVVFSWPGVGLYTVNAMQHSDYDPVIGIVILSAVVLSAVYLFVDIVSALIDPRLRLER